MFTISEASELSNMSAHTIRYYEKIGLLPLPKRTHGERRMYSEADVQFMLFLKRLKQTGMTLDDINEFVKDGCILEKIHSDKLESLSPSLNKRIEILSRHLNVMEEQKADLEKVIATTQEKLAIYHAILQGESDGGEL